MLVAAVASWQVGGWADLEGWPDNSSISGKERGGRGVSGGRRVLSRREVHCSLSAHCPQALSHSYRGVQLLCFVVCLYQGRGGGVTICLCL